MKKILILMMTAILLCGAVFTLSSCFGGGDDESTDDDGGIHTHTMSEWKIEIPATCTEDGRQSRKCTGEGCNHQESKIIPASGHNLVHHEGQEPTCNEKGFDDYDTCTGCFYTTYKEIDALGHSYEKGNGDICDNCGQKHIHVTFGEWTVVDGHEASCDENGLEQRKCDGCNYVEERITDMLPHSIGDDGKCTECGGTSGGIYLPGEEF